MDIIVDIFLPLGAMIVVIWYGYFMLHATRQERLNISQFVKKNNFKKQIQDIDCINNILDLCTFHSQARVSIDTIMITMGRKATDWKVFDAYRCDDNRFPIYLFTVTTKVRSDVVLAPAERYIFAKVDDHRFQHPFLVNIWPEETSITGWNGNPDTYSKGFTYTLGAFTDDPLPLAYAGKISEFNRIDFFGPENTHPSCYIDPTILELISNAKNKGITNIAYRDGLLLFTVFYCSASSLDYAKRSRVGNTFIDLNIPYKHIIKFLDA